MRAFLHIGPYRLRNRVFLAPMAGVTDAPFRAAAWRLRAGLVVAEMAAGKQLLTGRQRERLRNERSAAQPHVVQLAGHEPAMMARAAALALEHGAEVIDINMGCPAKMVTGKLSGAALMRDATLAGNIIEAVLAVARQAGAPVSVKMRLGWDERSIKAPHIARMAADMGVAMITVHGRTRQQFYRGQADWRAVGGVVRALREAGHGIAVIVNGDITDADSARAALAQSGADGVMIGRAATGLPWLPGEVAGALEPGTGIAPLPAARQVEEIRRLQAAMVAFHGLPRGLRRARKHLKAALTHWQGHGWLTREQLRRSAQVLLRTDDPARAQAELAMLMELVEETSMRVPA